MATWTNLVDRTYRQVLTAAFLNQLIENTRWLKETVDRVVAMLEPTGTRMTLLTANITGINTTETTVLSATINVPAGKGVKISAQVATYSNDAADVIASKVRRGSTMIGEATNRANSVSATQGMTQTIVCAELAAPTGLQTYSLTLVRVAGGGNTVATGSVANPGRLLLEVI